MKHPPRSEKDETDSRVIKPEHGAGFVAISRFSRYGCDGLAEIAIGFSGARRYQLIDVERGKDVIRSISPRPTSRSEARCFTAVALANPEAQPWMDEIWARARYPWRSVAAAEGRSLWTAARSTPTLQTIARPSM